jgi:peptidoglycan/LPS O-acetylase OafA/YrhL
MKRLNYLLQRDYNSLDFIRFLAAIGVIFAHSFVYALGPAHQFDDPLYKLTNGIYTSGQLAVVIFFVTSGFLVTASLDRSRSALTYVKARVLRIYPGLIGVVLVSIFIVGPLFTTLSLSDYFSHPDTLGYLRVLTLYNPTLYTLPGVFETNALPSMINGSLWTLFFEALCYGLVLLLWCLHLWRKWVVLGLWAVLTLIFFFSQDVLPLMDPASPTVQSLSASIGFPTMTWTILWLMVPFCAGMVFYFFREHLPMKGWIVLLGLPLLWLTLFRLNSRGLATLWFPTFGAYTLFYLATLQISPFKRFGRFGDFSYGMYIYAPLVHQSVTYLFGGSMRPHLNFILTTGITLIPAVLSWYLIEKPALGLKNFSLKRERRVAVPAETTP